MCDGYRLKQAYLVPVVPSLLRYYEEVVLNGKSEKAKIVSINRYKKKLIKKGLVKAA
jgi:hypothetical protein